MKRLLVLGASLAQIPFIKSAKKMGCFVGIVDYNPSAPAVEFADEYYECSLLDVDGVLKSAKEFRADGITCGTSDVGVLTAAYVCKDLHLPGLSIETATKVKDKGAMIQAFRDCDVAHPYYQVVDSLNETIQINYPIITKPVDNSASRGIYIAHNETELKYALQNSFSCSKSGRVIVEEYLDGPEVSVEILVQDGEPYVLQVTDKITSGEPHFIEMGHSQPSQLPPLDVDAIKKLAYNAAKAVGIKNGCGHAEIKLTSKGPKMVEIAGRLGGDFITTVLLPISTGINISEYEILRAIGEPKAFDPNSVIWNRGVAVKFIEAKPGKVKSVAVDYLAEEMVGVEEVKFVCKSDIQYGEAANNNDRFGYIIATGKTTQTALDRCDKVLERIHIEMD